MFVFNLFYLKVGIVGRTGSGKSSLFQALFRTTEIVKSSGSSDERGGMEEDHLRGSSYISIDGASIQRLSLRAVRKHLAIIPQQPFLFR